MSEWVGRWKGHDVCWRRWWIRLKEQEAVERRRAVIVKKKETGCFIMNFECESTPPRLLANPHFFPSLLKNGKIVYISSEDVGVP